MLPGWSLRVMYGVESLAYRHASLVSTITLGMQKRILSKGTPPHKVTLFEPRLDENLTEIKPSGGSPFRAQCGLEGKFLVTHSGNVGEKQGLEVILETAALCRDD